VSEARTLYTASEIAQQLGLSAETIRRACRSKRLPHYKFAGTIRISREQLLRYLELNECHVSGQQDQPSSGIVTPGPSSGGSTGAVVALRRARQANHALNKPSRTSRPLLKVIPSA